MKELDLSQLFCEVVSGLAASAVVMVFLDLTEAASITEQGTWLQTNLSLGGLGGLLLASYVIGLGIDALGLVVDTIFEDRQHWISAVRQPDHDTFRRFCVRAPEHVFAYWKEQWTYYSLYRNLAICVLVGSIPGVLLVSKYAGRIWTAVVAAALAAILACLYWAMRALLTLYRNIVWDVGPNRRAPASSRDR